MVQNELRLLSQAMADAVEQAGRSLVTVFGRARQPATGIVFAEELVLTADHVLERDTNLSVAASDGTKRAATLVGRDPLSDIAVLRVSGLTLPALASASEARPGQLALAVGRPSEEGLMVSLGVVSKVTGPTRLMRGGVLEQIIRTDATPYPGFSGGALIDLSGAAFGMLTTGLLRGEPVVIPMAVALRIANTLAQKGQVRRGYLGVITQQVKLPPSQRAPGREQGLLVVRVEDDSPAERGGVIVGDILIAVEGQPVRDADELLGMLSGERVGQAVQVEVLRGGVAQMLTVVVGQRNA
ncbi:MAG: trypsin-like peptidase domain-containing protein [Anaerolineae bacterium]|nr:S1C family serine protease [Thermoflexales bacterium]MDW8394835.1 trypsin-like peptidase domain-containing protein [Anaerolineae bacterium]